jgi:type I restriction enzyme M protein
MGRHGIGKIYGQEKNITTYNLARMNMLLHGVKDSEFEIFHGDTLTNDWDMLREMPTRPRCRSSMRWWPTRLSATAGSRPTRWARTCASRTTAWRPSRPPTLPFLLHGFHYLKPEGVMAIILPHGVLFRGGAEERIRTKLLKDGHIDTVIGLPANLFFSTGIPVCILVLKKVQEAR